MEYKKLIYFMIIEMLMFIGFGTLAFFIGDTTWNIRALHFIIFQDWLFIIFSILPAMGGFFMSERIQIFNFHCIIIAIHTINGVILVVAGKHEIDPQFFVSVACLVFIGWIFTAWVSIMLLVAYCSGDFETIFDEQFLNIDNSTNRRLDENFMEHFENINTLIYHKYISLNNNSCPICLWDYQEDEALKILPGCYHTFHQECIQNWFKNQLKCPFCRIAITKEQINKDKDMTEEDLIKKVKNCESVCQSEQNNKSSMEREIEVRIRDVQDNGDYNSDYEHPNILKLHKRSVPKFRQVPQKMGNMPKPKHNRNRKNNHILNTMNNINFVLDETNLADNLMRANKNSIEVVQNDNRKTSKNPNANLVSHILQWNDYNDHPVQGRKKNDSFSSKSIDGVGQKMKYFKLQDEL